MPDDKKARARLVKQISAIPGLEFKGKRDPLSNSIYEEGLGSYTKGDMEGAARAWMRIPNHPEGRTGLRRVLGSMRSRQ